MPRKRLDVALDVARSPIQPKTTDEKMTTADTITDTTFLTNYTSDSNFKL